MFQHAIKVVLAAIVLVMGAFGADAQVPAPANRTLTRVAFGSCANQEVEQPIWLAILGYKPELFLFGGDNVYADVQDGKVVTDPSKLPGAIAAAYDKAATIPGMKLLRESVPHLAVWALNTSVPELRWVGETANWHTGTAPRSSNPNLHAQSGLFTFCHWVSEGLRPLDELVSESLTNFMGATMKTVEQRTCVMRKLVLPRSAAKDLMRLLHVDGVSGLTMFPGYTGASKHVQERLWSGMTNPPPAAD